MLVRTRFAPSPTGFLHVGGVRTAFFAWLYARHHRGEFILRIEDTDRDRSTEDSVQAILDGMDWLGLDYDQGPFYQSDRYERYHAVVAQLLAQGSAYRCSCTKERLEALRAAQLAAKEKPRYDGHCRYKNLGETESAQVIRFKNPDSGEVSFKDEVYGEIKVANAELDDLILLRSDGHPTYNFAVVIDDWDMQISHVIRGDDHINNTPKQINLYRALRAEIPIFAHLPMILGDDGKRLSKRHGAVSILQFKDEGFLAESLLNYLVRLGWSHGDQEIFSLDEMIRHFDLRHISRSASSFNYDKLSWLNQHYQKTLTPKNVAVSLAWHFKQQNIDQSAGPSLTKLIAVQAGRYKTLVELCEHSRYFYENDIKYDDDACKKHLRPVILEPLQALYARLSELCDWQEHSLHQCIDTVSAEFGLNMGKIAQPLRVAITGSGISPSIDTTLVLLGKDHSLARLKYGLEYISVRAEKML